MLLRILAGMCVVACSALVRADLIPNEHIVNGTFGTVTPDLTNWVTESNTLTNWSGTTAIPTLGAGPYAITGNSDSSTNQRLYQEFILPSLAQESATLTWRDRYSLLNTDWIDGALEYRVILQRIVGGTPVGPILEAFSTALTPTVRSAAATNRSKSDSELLDFVTANLGQTVRLSFEALDNGTIPTVSVDTVSFITVFNTESVPEPSSLLLALIPGIGIAISRRRQRAIAKK